MKLMFLGMYEQKSTGCKPCGKSRKAMGFSTIKTFILPSGSRKTFRRGKAEEVNDDDAAFLLEYKDAFEVV